MKPSIIVAAIVLAGLVSYIAWFDQEPSPEVDKQLVFELTEGNITELELLQPDAEPIQLVLRGDQWRMARPVNDLADRHEVEVLLRHLEALPVERTVAPPNIESATLEGFGLASPALEVRFRTASGGSDGIAFGADTPTGTGQFARRWSRSDDGIDSILIVPPYQTTTLQRGSWELRDKRLFRIEDELEPRGVTLERNTGSISMERREGLWLLTSPIQSVADRIAAVELVSTWRSARIEEALPIVASGESSRYGLDAPSYRLRFAFDQDVAATVEIGSQRPDGAFHARTPPRPDVLVVSETLVSRLDADPVDLASKKLFNFSAFHVRRVTIAKSGEAPRVIEKIDPGDENQEPVYREVSDPDRPRELDTESFQQLLYKLNSTEASGVRRVTDWQKLALETPPAWTLEVWSDEREAAERLRVGAPLGGNVYARRAGEDVALILTLEQWRAIEELLSLQSS